MEGKSTHSSQYRAAYRRMRRLRGFYAHLLVYLAVNAGLLGINLLSAPGRLWMAWPLAGWGIALAIHGVSVLLDGRLLGPDWERRKLDALMRRDGGR